MNSLRKKILLQFLVSNGATAANFGLSIVLARLLSPSEIGIFSMTAIAVSFAHVFRDFGVVSFIKQQKELNSDIIATATGVLITTSWAIAAVLYLLSSYWANWFDEPGIEQVMHVLALGFVFIPFGAIPQAVLTRNFEVGKQAIATIVSTATYISAAILLALNDFSYMSMAWANLVNILVTGACYIVLRPPEVTMRASLRQWRRVVNFGTGAMLTSSLKAIDLALPDILLGKMSGAHQVGLFSRANSTVNILNHVAGPTINYVALPYLARVHHGGHDMAAELKRVIAYISGIFWPALAVTAVLADPIIVLLYGEAWRESATAMGWLCLACAAQTTFSLTQPALTGIGRPYLSAIALICAVTLKILFGILLYDGSLASFGIAIAIADLLTMLPYIYLLTSFLGLRLGDILGSLGRTTIVAASVLGATLLCRELLPANEHPAFVVGLSCLVAIPVWYLAIRFTQHPLTREFSLLQAELGKRLARS
ncbi:MAG TPA: oligosaccharide flippase family protein [Rhodocyclaceae bacterium]|nr:oligosaccharide flippase family protein [Rhodocyclaceae bacterium]